MVEHDRCCECKCPFSPGDSVLVCADCKGVFHYPDSRLNEQGRTCGTHLIGMREITGWDVLPLCLRCDMAIRLKHGIPS